MLSSSGSPSLFRVMVVLASTGIADSGTLLCVATYNTLDIRCFDSYTYAEMVSVAGRPGYQSRGMGFTLDGQALAVAYMGATYAGGMANGDAGAVVVLG